MPALLPTTMQRRCLYARSYSSVPLFFFILRNKILKSCLQAREYVQYCTVSRLRSDQSSPTRLPTCYNVNPRPRRNANLPRMRFGNDTLQYVLQRI